jgi:hypothetical protein
MLMDKTSRKITNADLFLRFIGTSRNSELLVVDRQPTLRNPRPSHEPIVAFKPYQLLIGEQG